MTPMFCRDCEFSLTQNCPVFVASKLMRGYSTLIGLGGSLAVTLCACTGPKVAGGEVGGVVPLIGITQEQAFRAAQDHCAAFGHVARTLAIRSEEGGKFVFECR
jgi:hypothetical protein